MHSWLAMRRDPWSKTHTPQFIVCTCVAHPHPHLMPPKQKSVHTYTPSFCILTRLLSQAEITDLLSGMTAALQADVFVGMHGGLRTQDV